MTHACGQYGCFPLEVKILISCAQIQLDVPPVSGRSSGILVAASAYCNCELIGAGVVDRLEDVLIVLGVDDGARLHLAICRMGREGVLVTGLIITPIPSFVHPAIEGRERARQINLHIGVARSGAYL